MSIMKVPVTKGKGTVEIDTDAVPEQYYKAALEGGFKLLVNGGASKITITKGETDPAKLAAYHKAAMDKAQERVAAMMAGTLKLGRAAASKGPSGEVMTEARRIARQLVKDALRAAGLKVSHYAASEITEAANAMLKDDSPAQGVEGEEGYVPAGPGPGLIAMAEAAIEARKKKPATVDLSHIKADPELVKKAEEKKAKAKIPAGVLSKTQAGKVAPRASTVH